MSASTALRSPSTSLKKRHDSDTAVVQQAKHSRNNTEVDSLKDELADKVEAWKEKVQLVGSFATLDARMRLMCASTAGAKVLRETQVPVSSRYHTYVSFSFTSVVAWSFFIPRVHSLPLN